jgi:hypothetical protein
MKHTAGQACGYLALIRMGGQIHRPHHFIEVPPVIHQFIGQVLVKVPVPTDESLLPAN